MIFILIMIFLQIVVESLPISSSGHLRLLENIFEKQFSSGLDYFLHGPTIVILLITFYREWSRPVFLLLKVSGKLLNNLLFLLKQSLFSFFKFDKATRKSLILYRDLNYSSKKLFSLFFDITTFVFFSNLVTVFIWVLFSFYVKKQYWFNSDYLLLSGFSITAILLFLLKVINLKKNGKSFNNNMVPSLKPIFKYLILGFIQGVALFPGISRFAFVYISSRLLGFNSRRAFEVTFLIQFPLIVAGFFMGSYKLFRSGEILLLLNLHIIISIILATIISLCLFRFVKSLAYRQKLYIFSYYMLIPIFLLIVKVILTNANSRLIYG